MRAIMPAGIENRRLEQPGVSQTLEHADDVRLVRLLTYIALGWVR